MPIIIRCHSCGFVLYNGNELSSIDLILREWGYRCPVCMSPLSRTPIGFRVVANNKHVRLDDDKIRDLIINALKDTNLTTTEIMDEIAEKLGIDTINHSFRNKVKDILYKLERDGVIIRAGVKGRKIIWALKA